MVQKKISYTLRGLILLDLLVLAHAFAAPQNEFADKIAFLRGGEVWVANPDGLSPQKLTSDSGRADEFFFSPTLKYLAYAKVIGSAEEPGLWDSTETPPQRAICSIVILDLGTKMTLKEMKPTHDPWIYIDRWLPEDKLLYHGSDGFSVSGSYVYDLHKDTEFELPPSDDRLLGADYSPDGTLEAYVDYSGRGETFRCNLHLVHSRAKIDTILASRKGTISDQRISHDKNSIAFLEVEGIKGVYFDILWLYDRRNSACVSLYRGPAKPKSGGVNSLAWSFDDRYVGMFFPPEAIVLIVHHPAESVKIPGDNFCWAGNERIIFNQGDDTYLYDLRTNSRTLLIEHARKPVFLHGW